VAFDFTDKVRFDEQQRRLLHLEQLSTTFLESFLVTDDIMGTTKRMLDVLGRYFSFSRAKILERDSDDDEFQLSHAWSHEETLTGERSIPPASISGERISWWIEQVRGGVPFTVTQDELSRNIDHEVQSLTDADSALIVPVLVLGRLELLILIEDREQQRKWQPEELATIQTMAHAVARSLERQRLEEDRAEFAEYRRTIERTELIGHLASGIAHDFNNIVFAVSGRTQLLLKRTEDEYIRNGLEQIDLALGDAKGIIGALRMMNNKVEHRTGVVAIAPATRRLTSMIRRLIPNRIGLDLEIRVENEVNVAFSADALLQVLMNLVINARDAVEDEGHIRITIDDRGEPDRPIRMMIDDDGPGIPESMRQEVLKPFVSTKEENKGTGLGLSIVSRVIRDHLGSLVLEGSDLGGLQVVVGMELADSISTTPESDSPPSHGAALKTVCIVEDEPVIRGLLARYFEDEGIEVIQLPDALTVGELLEDPEHQVDVLVMDIDLPEMTGVECLERLREHGVMIPCVLMTGGFNEPPENTEHMQMIRKPFPMESLQAICSVLLQEYRSAAPRREQD
jgi:signal transduction histidine kinase/CheY-like chemotaxis protein